MPRRKDIWRCGLIAQPVGAILAEGLSGAHVHWLPESPRFQFLADPFAWHGPQYLHIFAETYNYATRHGTIDLMTLDETFQLLERRPCLAEPWHLSYPCVFDADGATWMLPEAYHSGGQHLYRMSGAPHQWVRETEIKLDCIAVDPTPLFYNGRWWLFYSPATSKATKIGHLHVAWAENLTGPWTAHPGNPVRIDRASSRPGGTATVIDGRIMLPVQDCTRTYGGAIRPLWITRLDEAKFSATAGAPLDLPPSAGAYREGMHTLSSGGSVTLIDVKKIDRSLAGLALDIKRTLKRAFA